jgi:Protein phosphatase 2C
VTPEIIDSLSIAGDRAKVNDDAFGSAGNRLWVLDGATGLGASLLPGRSDAAWLARTANRLLHTHHAIRDTDQLVTIVIEGLVSAFAAERLAQPEARWQLPCAALLLLTFETDTVEAVWLGDCRAVLEIGGATVSCGETPEGEAEERAYAATLGKGAGAGAMLRSEAVIAALRESRDRFNTGRGRWVLGLEPEAAVHLQRLRFARTGPVTGLAMSDGFSALELKYKRYATDALIPAARAGGLAAMAGELRRIEEVEDPHGAAFPRFKRSDDATAILFHAG